jgi:hypothetical protein
MNAHELTLVALAESNPPVAVAIERVGPNRGGWPLIGLVGWLPLTDRLDGCRAVIMAHDHLGTEVWNQPVTVVALARMIFLDGGWRRPRSTADAGRVEDAVIAYARAKGAHHPICELMTVQCLRASTTQCQGFPGCCRCARDDTSER